MALRVLESYRLGLARGEAASLAGVTRETLLAWERAEPDWADVCEAARAEGKERAARVVKQAMEGEATPVQLQAAQFYLRTRRRGAWVERRHTEVSGQVALTVADILRREAEE